MVYSGDETRVSVREARGAVATECSKSPWATGYQGSMWSRIVNAGESVIRRLLNSSTPSQVDRVPTFWGWSPGVRLVKGGSLACGCLVGTYAQWHGVEIVVVDAKGWDCRLVTHSPDVILGTADGRGRDASFMRPAAVQ
jgi:hypothetical protein